MSQSLVLIFSIPFTLYLSLVISEKYFNKSKKSFYGMFYGVLGLLTLILGACQFAFMRTIGTGEVAVIKKIAMVPLFLWVGTGVVLGIMCIIKPLEFAKFLKEHKRLFLSVLITCISLLISSIIFN
jgi:uncharacterized membrane protein